MVELNSIANSFDQSNQHSAQAYSITRATSSINIDGALTEDAWKHAAAIKLIYEWYPGDNVKPPVETECFVTYDEKNLYIAFKAYDPEPSKIRAHLMDRDAVNTFIQDDHVAFIIDAFNDERRGFQFRINPLGVQADANFSESEGYEDFSWDAIWDSAGRITSEGYTVEVTIPFNQLRFPSSNSKQTWGFIAERSYPRTVRHRIRSMPTDRNINCLLCQENKITGIEGINPGRNIEFDPTLTANRTDTRAIIPDRPMNKGKAKLEPGITARWGIAPNMILNATANPDFSQVEADVAQLQINTRYALYYPEKRPFFLEGADFFLTPMQAVFTRTVADPFGGLKLTGKSGKNAIGFFGTYDRVNNLLFPANQGSGYGSIYENVTGGVFRYRRDISRSSIIGVLYTRRAGKDYYNHVTGIDGFFHLTSTHTILFQYLHSFTEYPAGVAMENEQPIKPFNDNAYYVEYYYASRNWFFYALYRDLGKDFRADYGFFERVDTRRIESSLKRIFWGKKDSWFSQINASVSGVRVTDNTNALTDQVIYFTFQYYGPLQSYLSVQAQPRKELYQNIMYNYYRYLLYSEIKPASGLHFYLSGKFGGSVDYDNARIGNVIQLDPGFEINFGKHFNISLDYLHEQLKLQENTIYTAKLAQLRLIYNLDRRTFLRFILQYLDLDRNIILYTSPIEPTSKNLFTQFLFSYKINPQTVLFLGYSDNYFGSQNFSLARTDRTLFFKIGYAWII